MPNPGQCWWHLILHTRGSWLHGDPRGFRSRGYRLQSTGDYKRPPPLGEHSGLHRFHRERSRAAILIAESLRSVVGEALRVKCLKAGHDLLVVSAGPTHAHLLVELDDDYATARQFEARLKQAASHAVRREMPGRIWARGGRPIRVAHRDHHRAAFDYIRSHANEGAWVWTFREG